MSIRLDHRRITIEPESGWISASFAYALTDWNPWTMRGFTACKPPLVRSKWIGNVKFVHLGDILWALRTSRPLPRGRIDAH